MGVRLMWKVRFPAEPEEKIANSKGNAKYCLNIEIHTKEIKHTLKRSHN